MLFVIEHTVVASTVFYIALKWPAAEIKGSNHVHKIGIYDDGFLEENTVMFHANQFNCTTQKFQGRDLKVMLIPVWSVMLGELQQSVAGLICVLPRDIVSYQIWGGGRADW